MAITENHPPEDFSNSTERAYADIWQPQWLVDVGQEIMVGVAVDDGCYVTLTQNVVGQWQPMTHVPVEAAQMIGRLARDHPLHTGS